MNLCHHLYHENKSTKIPYINWKEKKNNFVYTQQYNTFLYPLFFLTPNLPLNVYSFLHLTYCFEYIKRHIPKYKRKRKDNKLNDTSHHFQEMKHLLLKCNKKIIYKTIFFSTQIFIVISSVDTFSRAFFLFPPKHSCFIIHRNHFFFLNFCISKNIKPLLCWEINLVGI